MENTTDIKEIQTHFGLYLIAASIEQKKRIFEHHIKNNHISTIKKYHPPNRQTYPLTSSCSVEKHGRKHEAKYIIMHIMYKNLNINLRYFIFIVRKNISIINFFSIILYHLY